ncbi:toll/interleukin-1 receptor domain-containing protein [Sulfuriferula nivalis]|uniref:TIR domain-containing protein n=1 Tax=Sulfuriferula nivalis TaxID=2675298 RepID=A0A809RRA3_9PROT|nr:toll/interleukin-1 receptor domain-containing protein [Sulfuriferula nivalis]BBP01401.1 hypothetical protein SFSGTM_21090 [Sulfuriferula nivalis]
MKQVFISHSSADKPLADEVCAQLERRGLSCWIAPRDIDPGKDYGEEIILGIENCVATVLLLSESANQSIFVRKEIERAVSKLKPVFPVRVRNVAPSKGLELFISSSHWIDAWQPPMDIKMDQLAASILALVNTGQADASKPEEKYNAALTPPKYTATKVKSGLFHELRHLVGLIFDLIKMGIFIAIIVGFIYVVFYKHSGMHDIELVMHKYIKILGHFIDTIMLKKT